MSSYDRKNFFEVLGAFVPGYKGYSEKEMRRDTDRFLREAIVTRLQEKKRILDDLTKDFAKRKKFDHLDSLDSIRRRIDHVSDSIRHAPQGYSGFFDTKQVKNEDLDKLYRHDLALKDGSDELAKAVADLSSAADTGKACEAVLATLQSLDEAVRRRSEVITEVA